MKKNNGVPSFPLNNKWKNISYELTDAMLKERDK